MRQRKAPQEGSEASRLRRPYAGTGREASFSWGHCRGSHRSQVGPPFPVPGRGKRERRTPYLLLIRHPILEVGHLGLLWPSPALARGRPGRKPNDGITVRAVGRTRPETPTARAPCQLRAGVMAPGLGAQGSRLTLNLISFSLSYIHFPTHFWDIGSVFRLVLAPGLQPFPYSSMGRWESFSTGIGARAPADQIAVATPVDFPSTSALHNSRAQRP